MILILRASQKKIRNRLLNSLANPTSSFVDDDAFTMVAFLVISLGGIVKTIALPIFCIVDIPFRNGKANNPPLSTQRRSGG